MAASQVGGACRPSFHVHPVKRQGARFVVSRSGITSVDVVAGFYETAQHSFFQHNSSLEWWMPTALLWFTLATPSSLLGIMDFVASPIHAIYQKEFRPENVEVGKRIGEGSFGVVYEGFIVKGNEKDHVILKKAKPRVSGASEMHSSEVYMNQYLQRNASSAVAKFLGTVHVKRSDARGRLTEGIWLVWKFQGCYSLDYFMKQKRFPANIADQVIPLNADNGSILRTIMKQIFSNLQQIHRVGVIHRDVKPLNVILAEDSNQFKLVDFGACVNLRSGYNYAPKETVMDPVYAAPENYVMPTSTPRLPPEPFCSVIAPFVWLLNTPDRFDIFSAGLVMMQLAVKPLRSDIAMKRFTEELKRAGYDMKKWRQKCQIEDKEFWLLDEDDGSGWELVTAILRPRHDRDFFIWPGLVNGRPSASAVLRHRFFKQHLHQQIPDILGYIPELILKPKSVDLTSLASNIETMWTQIKPNENTGDKLLEEIKNIDLISVTITAIAISTTWTVVNGLQTSVQISYEAGRKGMEYVSLLSILAAIPVIIKPILKKMQQVVAKVTESPESHRLASHPNYGEVASLVDALNALEIRLSSLETCIVPQDQESLDSKYQNQPK